MHDEQKTKQQLIEELVQLRSRVIDLETQLATCQRAEADHRRINDSLPVLVATAGLDGYYKEVNTAFTQILGWSEQESLSRPFSEFIHPDDRDAALATLERLKSGYPVIDFVDRNVCKDGSYRWISWTVIPVLDRGIVFGIGQDITERRVAEASLKESERRLSTLVSNLPGAVYRCKADEDWTVEFLSDGYHALTGYDPAELIGQPGTRHTELIHPDDQVREFEMVRQAIAARRPYEVEYRLRTTAGGEKWLWERGTGVFSDKGELAAIEGFTTDITAQKEAELGLRQSRAELEQRVEERTAELTRTNERLQAEVEQRRKSEQELAIFQRFAEASGLGFGMADLDGHITYVNPTLFRWSGEQRPQDCLGKPLSAYMPAGYTERREKEILPAIRQNGFWQGEETLQLRGGRTVNTLLSVFPVRDEGSKLLRAAVVITDISDLKRAERVLRENEAKYRALVESCPDPVVMTDLQGKVIFASQRAVEQHGAVNDDELIGREATDFVVESHKDELKGSIGRLVEDGVHRNVEFTFRRKDGSTFDAEISSAVIRDDKGKPKAMMAVYRDVTERKEAQASLYRMLQASDRERELITYDIHDGVAQQLLGAKMHFDAVSQLKHGVAADAMPTFEKGLSALRQASAEARSLMNRTRTPVLQKYGVRPAIADFIDQSFEKEGAPEILYHCEARFGRLEPVLENAVFRVAQEAITNACNHSKCKVIRVSVFQRVDEVTIAVQDDGIGFDTSEAKENRFGLHGIRERVRLLGKHLVIESKPGEGTRVEATFPLVYRQEEAN